MSLEEQFQPPKFPRPEGLDKEPELPNHLLNRALLFDNSLNTKENRPGQIKILSAGEFLGKGGYSSWVRSFQTTIVNKEGDISPEHNFAVKKYLDNSSLERALAIFEKLKNKGLKVWTTFRINREELLAIMTHGNLDNKFIVSPNNTGGDKQNTLEKFQIEEIINFSQLVVDLLEQVHRASENGILLRFDTYGFFIDDEVFNESRSKVNFILSDLDEVDIDVDIETGEQFTKLKEENLKELQKVLNMFIIRYVKKSKSEVYNLEITDRIQGEFNKLQKA
jgi:hypothetical protein